MPIYSPTGFLDITNATLRTSNVEAENLLMTGGNIYVTSELETDATVLNLENVTRKGNVSSNTIHITNATTGIIATGNVEAAKFIGSGSHLTGIPPSAITGTLSQWSDGNNNDVYIASNVGIGNVHTLTSNTLQVGGNLYVRDTGSNVLTVNGNVVANYFEGDGSKLSGIVTDLQGVTDNGNTTTNVVQFSNATTGLVTTANIEVGGDLKIDGLTAGKVPYVAADKFLKDSFITTTGDATVISSNLDVTGNIFMRGNKFIVESETKLINDAIIGIANNNTSSTTDKGIIMQNTTGNVAIIHHGTGDGFADQLTFGYTADPLDTVTVTNDLTKELTVNVLGNVITQNNLSIGGLLKINTISAASSHSLQAVTNLGNVTSNTVQFSNAITSLVASSNIVATGNVSAGYNTNTTSYFGRAAVGYMGQDDHASFAHVSRNTTSSYALKQTAGGPTYINTPASGHIRFTVNDGNSGAEKMRITSAGKVGIGSNTPDATLHVVGNAYVSSNLMVSGNVSDLNIVSNVNMLHTANTAAIKLNSNVVTEFPRSKKLIKYPRVALTANSSGGYVASANSEYHNDYAAFRAFNNKGPRYEYGATIGWEAANSTTFNNSGTWVGSTSSSANTTIPLDDGDTIYGEWLQIQLPNKIRLEYVNFLPLKNTSHAMAHRAPRAGYILGSNNGTNWTTLKNWSGIVYDTWTAYYDKFYKFDIDKEVDNYQYFRFVWTETAGTSSLSTYASCQELEFWGVPEYDSDAHGTDVTIKSKVNVPNTDWLEVYYDAKDLADGTVSTTAGAITGLGGTTNNGTAYGGVTVSDGAFVLDGTNDYITTPALGFSGDQVHSVSLWFWSDKSQTDMTTEHGIYAIGRSINPLNNTNSARSGLSWWSPVTQPNSSLRYWHSGSGGKNFPDARIAANTWNHLVVVYPGEGANNIRIWLNDTELHGLPGSGVNNDFNWNASDHIILGDWYTGTGTVMLQSPWDGKIANFRLFNRALNTDEIYQLYAYQKEYFGRGDLSMTLKAGRLGIGTSEPRAALDVRGNVNVDGVPVLGRPAFYAEMNNATSRYEGPGVAVFNDVYYNRGSCYSASTGLFTAPIAGAYKFHCYGYAKGGGQNWWVRPVLNGSYWARGPYSTTAAAGEWIIPMKAGDTFGMYIPNASYAFYIGGDRHNGFSGYLIG